MRRAGCLLIVAALASGCVTPVVTSAPTGQAATAAPSGTPTTAPGTAAPSIAPSPTPAATFGLPPTIDLSETNARSFRVGPSPGFALDVNGVLYLAGAGKGIAQFGSTGRQLATWAIPTGTCGALDAGFGAVWSATCGRPGLARIDLKTGKLTTIDTGGVMPASGASVGVGEGGVWLIVDGSPHKLVKVDPTTLKVVGSYDISGSPTGARAGLGAVWITDPTMSIVHRVDPVTGAIVADIPVARTPQRVVVGEGAVWALDQRDGTISRIDPATNAVTATIDLGEPVGGGDIAVGGGSVWVRGSSTLLFQIEPSVNEVVAAYGPAAGSGSVAADQAAVWITSRDARTIWRLPIR